MATKKKLEKSDIDKIINLYQNERDNIANIGRNIGLHPKVIRRVLKENRIELDGLKNRFYRTLTEEHKIKISKSLTGKQSPIKGVKKSKEFRIRNIEAQLKLQKGSLNKFQDIEKLKFITRWITSLKFSSKGENEIINFIEKIYNDEKFNLIYKSWVNSGHYKWILPTLDHIVPISRGGDLYDISNMQILTWFENRSKNNMTQEEWEKFKKETNTTSDLFI